MADRELTMDDLVIGDLLLVAPPIVVQAPPPALPTLSEFIAEIDRGGASHCALYAGDGLIIQTRKVAGPMPGCNGPVPPGERPKLDGNGVSLDALCRYRSRSVTVHRHRNADAAQRAVAEGVALLDEDTRYGDLTLGLAGLGCVVRWQGRAMKVVAARQALDVVASAVASAQRSRRAWQCCEFVARLFEEVGHPLSLRDTPPPGERPPDLEDHFVRLLLTLVRDLVDEELRRRSQGLEVGSLAAVREPIEALLSAPAPDDDLHEAIAWDDVSPALVTPRLLARAFSPMGHLAGFGPPTDP